MRDSESIIEGRNEVIEAFRAGRTVEKVFMIERTEDGPLKTILREAKKAGVSVRFVKKERLEQLSESGKHQGVVAYVASMEYSQVDDILSLAEERNEQPFIILLDNVEDPHNLGAIIRTADASGAHGVIIPKDRSALLTAGAIRASAGAANHVLVAKVTNLTNTIEDLKKRGLWFVCADMDGDTMYSLDLKGPIGVVIGNEGKGVSRLVKEHCDMKAAIPMKGKMSSLNASVAAGIMMYEIVRQRG